MLNSQLSYAHVLYPDHFRRLCHILQCIMIIHASMFLQFFFVTFSLLCVHQKHYLLFLRACRNTKVLVIRRSISDNVIVSGCEFESRRVTVPQKMKTKYCFISSQRLQASGPSIFRDDRPVPRMVFSSSVLVSYSLYTSIFVSFRKKRCVCVVKRPVCFL